MLILKEPQIKNEMFNDTSIKEIKTESKNIRFQRLNYENILFFANSQVIDLDFQTHE